jgi:hypothetical protein
MGGLSLRSGKGPSPSLRSPSRVGRQTRQRQVPTGKDAKQVVQRTAARVTRRRPVRRLRPAPLPPAALAARGAALAAIVAMAVWLLFGTPPS